MELPVVGQVIEASAERPYLSLRLELDPALVGSVMVEAGHLSSRNRGDVRAIDVSPLDAELLDATVRLVRLLDSPAEVRVLRPLIAREPAQERQMTEPVSLFSREQAGTVHPVSEPALDSRESTG